MHWRILEWNDQTRWFRWVITLFLCFEYSPKWMFGFQLYLEYKFKHDISLVNVKQISLVYVCVSGENLNIQFGCILRPMKVQPTGLPAWFPTARDWIGVVCGCVCTYIHTLEPLNVTEIMHCTFVCKKTSQKLEPMWMLQ